jgi:hypothetical protein
MTVQPENCAKCSFLEESGTWLSALDIPSGIFLMMPAEKLQPEKDRLQTGCLQ